MSSAIVTLRDVPKSPQYIVDGYVHIRGLPGTGTSGETCAVLIDPKEGIFIVKPISRLRWVMWSEG